MGRLKLKITVLALCLLMVPVGFADAASLTIQSITPSAAVAPGTQVSFALNPSGFGSVITYTVSDSFGGASVSNANVNSSGVFSWIPLESDSGIHNLTIVASDLVGNHIYAYQLLTVQGLPTVSAQASVSTVRVGQTLTITASGFNLAGPTYTLTDSFVLSSILTAATSSTGTFTWKPQTQDIGTHTFTIIARDPTGASATSQQTVVVTPEAYLEVHSLSNTALVSGQELAFVIVPIGFVSPNYTITDSVPSSLSNSAISSAGNFRWVPSASDVGTHTITVYASDYAGKLANTHVAVTVVKPTPGVTAPTVMTRYTFYTTLAVGSRGTAVSELQKRLTAEGVYQGPVTGYFGALTEAGVKAYQGKSGIEAIGIVGPKTRASLNK